MPNYDLHYRAAQIVRDAGGQLIGRTRLQKVTYLTQLAGFGRDFDFEYRQYGPFSEDLASAMEIASGVGLVSEDERRAEWGGRYSIYTVGAGVPSAAARSDDRARFIATAAAVGAIELELAATAAFLYAEEGIGRTQDGDPWEETSRRKPDKANDGRLMAAKAAYERLAALSTPQKLPPIVRHSQG